VGSASVQSGIGIAVDERVFSLQRGQNGAAPESNRPSVGLSGRTDLKTGTQSRRLQRIRPKTAAPAPVCAPVAVRRTATLS